MNPRHLLVAITLAAALPAPAATPPRPSGRTGLVKVRYDQPKNPAHRQLYDHLRQRKVLEPFAEVLNTLRLPRPLTLVFRGCDGTSNAWYEPEDGEVIFCYEMVADSERAAAGAAAYGIPADVAADGPVAFVLLHESAHAVFDLLKVPILGREEDAADQVAAHVLLRTGTEVARRVLTGAAWMYKHDASARKVDESDFADVHGLDVQRFYNVLCMAYGSDAQAFGGLVEKGHLPKDRAEGCGEEFQQVSYAVRTLISKSVDAKAAQAARARHHSKWNAPKPGATPAPPAAPAATAAPPKKE